MANKWFPVGVMLLLASLSVVGCGIPKEDYESVAPLAWIVISFHKMAVCYALLQKNGRIMKRIDWTKCDHVIS